MANQLPIKQTLKHAEGNFKQLLQATGTDVARFMNNAIIASSENEDIAKGNVSAKSVLNVCSRAANDGLVLDGKEAAIVIGSVKKNGQWVKEAQYRQMIGGVMKMINRSPNIKFVNVQLVYENDICKIDLAAEGKPVIHEINLDKERGDVRGCYAYAKLTDGEYSSVEYMTTAQINAIRENYSSDKSPMWNKSWGEAARKTVLHRAKKRWPIDNEVEVALRDDEKGEDITIIEHEEEKPEPTKKKSVKDKVKAKMKETVEKELPPHNAETGEIEEAEYEESPPPHTDEDINDEMPI